MSRDKMRPIMIYHDDHIKLFWSASKEEKIAWKIYAKKEFDEFCMAENFDVRDFNVECPPSAQRDEIHGVWIPSIYFPEWVEKFRKNRKINKMK